MSKTNKELAVELFSAYLQASATLASSPNYQEPIRTPTLDEMVDQVAKLTQKLSSITNE